MIRRHLEKKLRLAARQYPVVSVTGPRQSGKTTLVQAVFSRHAYVSLEDPDSRAFAMEDPRGFLAQFGGRVVLDEVQRAPELFSYVQGIVDGTDRAGHFILTGSGNFLLMEKITQSLAGRCAILHLLPFSKSELVGQKMMDFSKLGRTSAVRKTVSTGSLFDVMFKGFYPRIHDKNLSAQDWLANYYQTYLERDVRQVLNVGDTEAFGRFVRLCAGRCGQLLNMSSLAADCGISVPTAKRWLSILEASFVIVLLRPHFKNFNKRLVKSPKLYFLDTGLLCYLLRVRSSAELRIHAARGAVFESWALSELLKNYHNRGLEPDVYFWRDSAGHEVDFLVEQGQELIAIEIKSGETMASDSMKGLDFWRSLPGQGKCRAALVYGGDSSYMRRNIAVTSWQDWG
ncbi:MAG: ATP-binding protein [Planctomycetota bacterium]|jgi:predicted AAA+ superfamily ATPase